MKKCSQIASTVVAANLVLIVPAYAGGFLEDIGNAVVKAGGDVVGTTVKAAQDTGHAVETATHQTGDALQTAGQQTGHAVETATHQVGDALEKAAHDSGRGIDQTGRWIGRHPWETVAAVALIAGGGYLIVAEHFVVVVSVEGVSVATISTGTAGTIAITAGAASGIATGSAALAGAAVVIGNAQNPAYGAGGSPDSPVAGDGFPTQQGTAPAMGTIQQNPNGTITITTNAGRAFTTDSPVRLPLSSGNRVAFAPMSSVPAQVAQATLPGPAESAPAPVLGEASANPYASVMYAPWLRDRPNEMEIVWYARRTIEWTDAVYPLSKFDPSKSSTFTVPEERLVQALITLRKMSNPAFETEKNAANRESHPVYNAVGAYLWAPFSSAYGMARGQPFDQTITIEGNAGFALWGVGKYLGGKSPLWQQGNVIIEVARPGVAGDGIGEERDRLTRMIQDRLAGYMQRRLPGDLSRPTYPIPTSPDDVKLRRESDSVRQSPGVY